MKKIIFSLSLLMSTLTFANDLTVSFRCTDKNIEACKSRVSKELESKNCGLVDESITCKKSTEDNNGIYCDAKTTKCSNASSDGFAGVKCLNNGEKVKIEDKKLTADWARTILWIWVKDMCINL